MEIDANFVIEALREQLAAATWENTLLRAQLATITAGAEPAAAQEAPKQELIVEAGL